MVLVAHNQRQIFCNFPTNLLILILMPFSGVLINIARWYSNTLFSGFCNLMRHISHYKSIARNERCFINYNDKNSQPHEIDHTHSPLYSIETTSFVIFFEGGIENSATASGYFNVSVFHSVFGILGTMFIY
uniref:Uncharacterized protein n=1 Tax=Glossina palpalis gambiensis TaxID=67801 RepID=A0A1B0BTW5_9MUSC